MFGSDLVQKSAGTVVVFLWQNRPGRGPGKSDIPGQQQAAQPVVAASSGGGMLRKAFVLSVCGVGKATLGAFKRDSDRYAPVPRTFSAAVFSNLPAIFGTTFSGNCAVSAGMTLVGIVCKRARRTGGGGGDSDAATQPAPAGGITNANAVTHGVFCIAGAVGRGFFRRKWEKSSLRGTLSVFGNGADLDRCANAERYLAEKTAVRADPWFRGAGFLGKLINRKPRGIDGGGGKALSDSSKIVPGTEKRTGFARGAIRKSASVLTNVGGFFSKYTTRYMRTHKDMNVLSDKLKYPNKQMEPVLSMASDTILAPIRAENEGKDIRDKRKELRRELGNQFRVASAILSIVDR